MTTTNAIRIANDSPFCESRRSVKKLEDDLISDEAMHAPLHEIEQMMRTAGRELMREMMQAHFDRRSAQEREVEVQDVDGIERLRVREGRRTVMTEFGEVHLDRKLYQAEGADALAPLDAAMELPDEKYSLEVRRIVAEEAARASFDEVVELVSKRSGAEVPKRQAEELAVRAARDFDNYYRSRLREPENSEQLLVLSFDAKGIATLHRDLREATRKKAESTPRRLETRLTKGEKPNRKRMAEVATVYSIDEWPRTIADVLHGARDAQDKAKRPRPFNKRVWASIEHEAERVIQDAFDEALRRDPDLRRRWVVLVDGNRDQLERIKRAARATGVKVTIVLDIVHVLEYLWRAAYAFHADGTKDAQTWVECRLIALLGGRSGGALAKDLRAKIRSHDLDENSAKSVEAAATYLTNNTRHMHYDRALARGLPIATGVIEGACRYLVQDRMGRTGAVWSAAGAEAVLRLRALRASGDFDDYWQFHVAKEHERTHQSRYADGEVPNPLPLKRPHLRLVK
ncbi:MAG: ISKra4 family transposase [Deltaproteobacteria bacterium]|nr:ISKra4 family transposase [Deltaproteobacteria bacterium]